MSAVGSVLPFAAVGMNVRLAYLKLMDLMLHLPNDFVKNPEVT